MLREAIALCRLYGHGAHGAILRVKSAGMFNEHACRHSVTCISHVQHIGFNYSVWEEPIIPKMQLSEIVGGGYSFRRRTVS